MQSTCTEVDCIDVRTKQDGNCNSSLVLGLHACTESKRSEIQVPTKAGFFLFKYWWNRKINVKDYKKILHLGESKQGLEIATKGEGL
jgi:hypothetical protein